MKRGDIAICSKGAVGMVMEDGHQDVVYKTCDNCRSGVSGGDLSECTCERGVAYVGVHLTDKIAPIGSLWSSRNPRLVGHISQFIPDNFPEEK